MASDWLARRFTTALTLPLAALALVTVAGCDLMMADLSARATEEWKRSYDLAAGGRVEVLNINGAIEIGPATGRTLEVLAEKTARGVSEEAAKAMLSRIEIVEQTTAKEVRIETRVPKVGVFNRGGASVRYVVHVPAGTEVRVRTVNGGVKLSDVSGTLKADTTNGSISGRGLDGSLEAGTTNGGIDIEMDSVAEGGVRLETTNGGIDLRIPKDTAATLSARLTNGRIEASSLGIQVQGEVSRRRLEGTLNGGGPRIALETTNGGITIAAKAGT